MEAVAKFKYVRGGPRKIRRVVDMVRGLGVQEALDILKFERVVMAKDVSKLIRSAIANANQKGGVRVDRLYIKKIVVDQATIMKRFMTRARGGAASIQKKMSHLSVILDERI